MSSHSDTCMCLSVRTTPSRRDRKVEGDSPDTRRLACMGCPRWLAALPGTIFAIWLCWALAFLLIFFLIIELLDPVLVAYLKQVGIGLQCRAGGYAVLFMNPPHPFTHNQDRQHSHSHHQHLRRRWCWQSCQMVHWRKEMQWDIMLTPLLVHVTHSNPLYCANSPPP